MQLIDQKTQITWRSKARGWREMPNRLITPGAVESMLHNRHELDMGEVQVSDIAGQYVKPAIDGWRSTRRDDVAMSPGAFQIW